jgi:TRAP transporter TAXI family solute receptor
MSGITSGGNRAGDIITAHGTALYRHDGQRWVAIVPGGYQPPVAPGFAVAPTEGVGAILAGLRKVVDAFPRDSSPAQHAAIQEELATAQANIQARLARLANGYAIAAGAEHGQYLRVAKALFTQPNSRSVTLITRGGEENLQLLRSGKVSLALAQGDAALDAYEGKGAFEGQGPHSVLRAIASLYPEPVHVLVRADDTRVSISDLRSSRVAIGEIGSASRTTALRVLKAHGLGLKDISAQELSIGAALLALQRNEVDAVFQVIGTPADSIRASLASMPLRLLPLSEQAVAVLVNEKRGYFPFSIAKGTYPNQEHDVRTVGTAALLLTDETLSDAEVAALTRNIFEPGHDYSSLGSAQAAQISLATSQQGVPVPMHAAAADELERMSSRAADIGSGAAPVESSK